FRHETYIQLFHLSRVYEVAGLADTQDWLIHSGGLAEIKAFRLLAKIGVLRH
ncbi:hypothetical protein OHL95_002639, partial [Enterococcus faecium]|nr:hypothetical protein [Enterococcus faecium]